MKNRSARSTGLEFDNLLALAVFLSNVFLNDQSAQIAV
jgi:hypothetical protein